jgi:hypothetical protein
MTAQLAEVQTQATQEQTVYQGDALATVDFLKHAIANSGKPAFEVVKEIWRLQRGRGKLPLAEYVRYGVYDQRHSPDDQTRFITNGLAWTISDICADTSWQVTVEDKWLTARMLDGSGVAMPATLAVIDTTGRIYPGCRTIATPADFADFVAGLKGQRVFAKENRGICSFGAFLIEGGDSETLVLKGHEPMAYDQFMSQKLGASPYIVQPVMENHPFFDDFTTTLATVRACVLVKDDGIAIPHAVLKLPHSNNVADNFWRKGNLACDVDPQTGEIRTLHEKAPLGVIAHETHPDTGLKLIGETVPMWEDVVELATRCAQVFAPLRYQAMDIAITPDGPVLIENNTGGGFDLPQLASGRGFLTDEVIEFFTARGYDKL